MHTYIAKFLNEIENSPRDGFRVASSVKVGVFRVEGESEEQVGEYIRNYPDLLDTFCYFRKDDKDFALYSPDYTATRILELPTCKDIGGEEPSGGGFCPIEFYVPSYIDREAVWCDDRLMRTRVNKPQPEDLLPKTMKCYVLDEKTG